jgi:MscS family membrane protein
VGLALGLPYHRSSPIGNIRDLAATAQGFSGRMRPPHLVERLPDWARRPIAGQVPTSGMLAAASPPILAHAPRP